MTGAFSAEQSDIIWQISLVKQTEFVPLSDYAAYVRSLLNQALKYMSLLMGLAERSYHLSLRFSQQVS
jgi:hypothetical protein